MSQEIKEIPMDEILADEDFNCRGHINAIDVVDLVKDIERNGLIQPVTVCVTSPEEMESSGKKYKLLAGFRRHMAHRVMEKKEIRAIVNTVNMSTVDQQFLNLSENLVRSQLTFSQEARAIKKLYDLGIGEQIVAERTGMSRGWVQVRYMYLRLPTTVQEEVDKGTLKQSQVRAAYTVFRDTGDGPELYAAVKKLKGTKNVVEARDAIQSTKQKMEARTQPGMPVVRGMQLYLSKQLGNGTHTQLCAWFVGAINSRELLSSLAAAHNIPEISDNEFELYIEEAKRAF